MTIVDRRTVADVQVFEVLLGADPRRLAVKPLFAADSGSLIARRIACSICSVRSQMSTVATCAETLCSASGYTAVKTSAAASYTAAKARGFKRIHFIVIE